jgi:hypothetical protein
VDECKPLPGAAASTGDAATMPRAAPTPHARAYLNWKRFVAETRYENLKLKWIFVRKYFWQKLVISSNHRCMTLRAS